LNIFYDKKILRPFLEMAKRSSGVVALENILYGKVFDANYK